MTSHLGYTKLAFRCHSFNPRQWRADTHKCSRPTRIKLLDWMSHHLTSGYLWEPRSMKAICGDRMHKYWGKRASRSSTAGTPLFVTQYHLMLWALLRGLGLSLLIPATSLPQTRIQPLINTGQEWKRRCQLYRLLRHPRKDLEVSKHTLIHPAPFSRNSQAVGQTQPRMLQRTKLESGVTQARTSAAHARTTTTLVPHKSLRLFLGCLCFVMLFMSAKAIFSTSPVFSRQKEVIALWLNDDKWAMHESWPKFLPLNKPTVKLFLPGSPLTWYFCWSVNQIK